jgi:hypothetical protein
MTPIKKTLALACAVSLLGFGPAFAQTDPNAAPAAPAAATPDTSMAPAGDASGSMAKPMKKHMKKKHMSKKMMKKKTM